MERVALSTERIVATSRDLLIEGGPPAVVVREVARRLEVSAPALYRHVTGRDDLLTLLIAACNDEVTAACGQALAGCAPDDHDARLRQATLAFRSWALANPPEFGLLYGAPIAGYVAPPAGPTVASSRRFGQLFGGIFADLLRAGRLRTMPDDELAPALRADLRRAADSMGLPMRPGQVYPFVVGWQRMLGLVSVEVSGHLRWAFEDADGFARRQLDELADELLLPTVGPVSEGLVSD